jgi:pimeloyl-ACP methyl ester carboxylesterase
MMSAERPRIVDRAGGVRVRAHGTAGPWVVAIHGGPAAAGEAAAIARGLADEFRVLEPWQRGSGAEPLSVARHIEDLRELIAARCGGARPALVGESWGAMLALAFAAEHPRLAGPLVLIGCGTFDTVSRARMRAILAERRDARLQRKLERLPAECPDEGERLARQYELMHALYDYDALPREEETAEPPPAFDVRAHTETWEDMLRLQAEGRYPAAFAAIRSPVLMLHGAYDPHPGAMIRRSLEPLLPQLEYHEWERCGHSPWRERQVRDEFFALLHAWLREHLADGGAKA